MTSPVWSAAAEPASRAVKARAGRSDLCRALRVPAARADEAVPDRPDRP